MFARDALEGMKRADIQKLCKDYGVRANLKTETLIDLLLDASQPQPPRRNLPQPPSTRIPILAGARPRGQSTGSIIIHGSDNDEPPLPQCRQLQSHEQSVPQRTRKAKQTQYRLGVGRPVIAGGSGARTITKSTSGSRTPKRTRSSRSVKPIEATITEEPELDAPIQVPSRVKMTHELAAIQPQPAVRPVAGPSSETMETVIANALAPVKQELESHKAQLTNLKEKVSSLVESFETKIRNLTSEIQDLLAREKDSTPLDSSVATIQGYSARIPEPPSTPKRVRTPYRPSFALPSTESLEPRDIFASDPTALDDLAPPDLLSTNDVKQHGQPSSLLPGFPHSILGKRPRDSVSSSTSGVFEAEQEGTETRPESNVGPPPHKRVKVGEPEDNSRETPPSEASRVESSIFPETSRRPGGFSVFRGREEDPPPPTERIENFYAPPSPPIISAPVTSSANNVENQNPFSFTFVPIASTPTQAVYPLAMGTFPHPEPPTSPSPAPNLDRPGSCHSDRLGAFGAPRSSSRASGRAASGGSQVRGEASGSNGLQRAPSSNEVASGLGLTAIKTSATEQGTPVPPAKRTMYGTELDGDTRFGDFGVDGVASGFWASGRF